MIRPIARNLQSRTESGQSGETDRGSKGVELDRVCSQSLAAAGGEGNQQTMVLPERGRAKNARPRCFEVCGLTLSGRKRQHVPDTGLNRAILLFCRIQHGAIGLAFAPVRMGQDAREGHDAIRPWRQYR